MSITSEFAQLLQGAEELKPLFEKAIPILLEIGVISAPIMKAVSIGAVNLTHESIERYIELGYTKEEAITLTMWNKQLLSQKK